MKYIIFILPWIAISIVLLAEGIIHKDPFLVISGILGYVVGFVIAYLIYKNKL